MVVASSLSVINWELHEVTYMALVFGMRRRMLFAKSLATMLNWQRYIFADATVVTLNGRRDLSDLHCFRGQSHLMASLPTFLHFFPRGMQQV